MATFELARIVDPFHGFSPSAFSVLLTLVVEDGAIAMLDTEWSVHADGESAFFLIAKVEVSVGIGEAGVPEEKDAVLMSLEGDGADFLAGFVLSI